MKREAENIDMAAWLLARSDGLHAAAQLAGGVHATGAEPVAMWLDIDRFHQINHSFGHQSGDEVIAAIAVRLREGTRGQGALSRMGSDEFLCLMPGLGRQGAERLADELRAALEAPLIVGGMLFHPSVSMGVAVYGTPEDPLAWLERADLALAEAKRQGGNRAVISGEDPIPGRLGVRLAREELAIEADLHTALETGGLELHYQPIVGRNGRVCAVEALMRCTANGRSLEPGRFIPVAEKTGLIQRLGEWSMMQGAQFAARLQREGWPVRVAVNVSRAQLTSPSFLQALNSSLICADVAPDMLVLELTESLVMDLSEQVQNNLRSARAVGVGLAIDDFGTGYSSLASLKDLPVSELKLDRAFVAVLPQDLRTLAIVTAVTQMGRALGMEVVAEGVETHGQQAALNDAGVDALQGYLLARPMPEAALLQWLETRRGE